ncbi:MAG TPA: glycosyltransferase family 2 protein [Steroidobacteraceae bacterium]|nr:glycosyltransferase family 2 protein [Steroidobacteraceae bacterium]
MPALPFVSVVTICKNAAATIERTLAGVAACGYAALEHVVVDGGSTDGTLELLERHRGRIDKLISEPDEGISDALNKAIALSEGEYHIIAHADDVLLPESLAKLADAAVAHSAAQVVCGRVAVMDQGRLCRMFLPEPAKLMQKMSVPHMGALVRKEAWEAVGGYDRARRIAMDHQFMLRVMRRFGPDAFYAIDDLVAEHSLGGVSDRRVQQGFQELRENLIEAGVSSFAAHTSYLMLLLKSKIARAFRGA